MEEVTLIGIILTFIATLINLFFGLKSSKKTLFINTVTRARVKFMNEVREYISEFCGLVHSLFFYEDTSDAEIILKGKDKMLKDIDRLRYLIKLYMNPDDEIDKQIIKIIDHIPNLFSSITFNPLEDEINKLLEITRMHLNIEWQGIKRETLKGNLKEKERNKINPNHVNY